jgi:hypothetical protein
MPCTTTPSITIPESTDTGKSSQDKTTGLKEGAKDSYQASSYTLRYKKALKWAKKYVHQLLITRDAFPTSGVVQQFLDLTLDQARDNSNLGIESPVKQRFEKMVSFHASFTEMLTSCLFS